MRSTLAIFLFVVAGTAHASAVKGAVDQAKQFDIFCRFSVLEWKDRRYGQYRGDDYPPPKHDWTREVVDLKLMKHCGIIDCREGRISNIESFDGRTIIFSTKPYRQTLRLRDGRFYYKIAGDGVVSIDRGWCRKLPFTGFNTTAPPP